jgi:hypothetical protein
MPKNSILEGLKRGHEEEPEESKTSQASVVYMTGDQGPFRCDHCEYFSAPNGCRLVEGNIDPAGCCNLFEKEDE